VLTKPRVGRLEENALGTRMVIQCQCQYKQHALAKCHLGPGWQQGWFKRLALVLSVSVAHSSWEKGISSRSSDLLASYFSPFTSYSCWPPTPHLQFFSPNCIGPARPVTATAASIGWQGAS
jgi:hypothetical protein